MNTNACCAVTCNTTSTATDVFTSTLKLIAATQCCFTDNFMSDKVHDKDFFDFIIVGGGSAGNVVANRLSEVGEWNVLLLEAGPKPPITGSIPQLSEYIFNTKYDWNYTTINNNRTSQALANGQVLWPRGKVLGGSSILNGMLYVKGRKADYQSWFNEGNPSWAPKFVSYYERKAESLQNYQLNSNPYVSKFYGKNGPQVVNRYNSTHGTLAEKILESWESIGFKQVIDPNTAEYRRPGLCGISTVTAANGIRYDTYRSYLLPIRNRKNLKIVTEAFVTKVLIDENKIAYGVQVDINGKTMQLFAKNEVILSAGAINSPQLLMLSGIGSKFHLESKDISCKVNLPAVGQNLQDHLRVIVPIYGDKSNLDNQNQRICSPERYCCNKTGFLAQGSIEDTHAFYTVNNTLKYPEIQNHLVIIFGNENVYINNEIYIKAVTDSLLEFISDKRLYLFLVSLLHPHSRGTILLNTSNPYDKPVIDANYFGDNRDLILTAKGILKLIQIKDTKFFKSINAFVQRIKLPECDKLNYNTLDYWMCYAKNLVATLYHPVGTCKMGLNPKDSVVDNFLRVHGVKKLRVIDASVMPTETSGNTNGPTIMVGEMGASMIKKSYKKIFSFNLI